MQKNKLIQKLKTIKKESGDKKFYWLEWNEMCHALKYKIGTPIEINKEGSEGTFSTIISFNGAKYIYIGKTIIHLMKSSA